MAHLDQVPRNEQEGVKHFFTLGRAAREEDDQDGDHAEDHQDLQQTASGLVIGYQPACFRARVEHRTKSMILKYDDQNFCITTKVSAYICAYVQLVWRTLPNAKKRIPTSTLPRRR